MEILPPYLSHSSTRLENTHTHNTHTPGQFAFFLNSKNF